MVTSRPLREHVADQILIFTESNTTVYDLSRRHLFPALTHETKAAERKRVLEAYRAGEYRILVTSKVLNEGVDVPEAKVAIVLGGTSSAREYIQLGAWRPCCKRSSLVIRSMKVAPNARGRHPFAPLTVDLPLTVSLYTP